MRLLVVGGGPAGMNAALHARELGADVTLIEAKRLGGTSLNDGPAAVRTLARAARLIRDAKSWERLGLRGDPPELDIAAALGSARRVADYVHHERRMADALSRRGIDLVDGAGPATFVDPHTVALADGRRFAGDTVVVAVGGRAGRPPIPGVEHALTYEDLRDLRALPASAVVIGGADTGCQLASILADFGVDVTLVEAGPKLVARADHDVSNGLTESFRARGIDVLLATQVREIERAAPGMIVHHGSGEQLEVDVVFLAVGWPGNADLMGAADVGIDTERGYIKVDEALQSNLPNVYAAGDVNGISMLVPSARVEGRIAAENAVLGTRRRFTHELVPTGSFTDPEYGGVGLTEAQAREHYDCEVAIARYADLRAARHRRSPGRLLQADRRAASPLHPRRPRPRRILSRGDPDRLRLHGSQPAHRAGRRAATGLPHLHRRHHRRRAEDRAPDGNRTHRTDVGRTEGDPLDGSWTLDTQARRRLLSRCPHT